MKNILLLLLLITNTCFASLKPEGLYFLTADSLDRYPNYITKNWKFSNGDDSAMASIAYDDSHWKTEKTTLYINDSTDFKGIGWFRLHFIADTSVTGKPLALTMTHFGASEIYVDGKFLKSFGEIKGADSSVYLDPREVPFVFMLNDTGHHVIAVRYANFDA